MEQIGPYVLGRRIGAGGMAEVWQAYRANLGARKTVAIKLLAPHLADNPQYRAMFVEEARLSMLLNHSNIVQAFDVGEDGDECYLAMEWIDGVNLAELQAALWDHGRVVPVGVAMYIAAQLLRALDYAHNVTHERAASIVHRDVSPANVMISRAGEVKLTDFGVARFGNEETSGIHVKGKLRYMAPEQLQGESRSGAVDLFSVGAILHEMLAGDKFRGSQIDEAQLIGMVADGVVPELPASRPVPQPLDTLRRALLEPSVARRLTNAREALQRLSSCPGYRQADLDLAALVGWYCGLAPEPSASNSAARRPEGSATAARSRARPATPLASGAASRVEHVGRVAAAVGLVVVGTGFGWLGLEVGRREPSASAQPPRHAPAEPAEAAPEPRPESSPPPAPVPTPMPAPVPAPMPRRTGTPEPAAPTPEPAPEPVAPVPAAPESAAPESVPTPEAKPPSTTPAKPKAEPEPEPEFQRHGTDPVGDPVAVRFVAGSFRYAYVKVAGKRLLIEPSGTLELPPGSHRVHVRVTADAPWAYFGRVRVRPGRPLVIKLVEPTGLEVKPQ